MTSNRTHFFALCVLFTSLVPIQSLHAQSGSITDRLVENLAAKREAYLETLVNGDLKSGAQDAPSQIYVEGSEDNRTAILRVKFALSERMDLALKYALPIDENSGAFVDLGNLESAGNYETYGFDLTYNFPLLRTSQEVSAKNAWSTLKAQCKTLLEGLDEIQVTPSGHIATKDCNCETLTVDLTARNGTPVLTYLEDVTKDIRENSLETRVYKLENPASDPVISGSTCSSTGVRDALLGYYPENSPDLAKAFNIENHGLWLAGISGEVGRETFKYVQTNDLNTEISDRERVSSYKAYVTRKKANWAASLVASRVRTFMEQNETPVCNPVDPTLPATSTCENSRIGAPTEIRRDNVSLEFRKRAPFGWKNTALSAVVTRDLENSEWGVRLPIYLLNDGSKENSLVGGISFAWDSESEDTSVGLFLSKPFTL